MFAQKRILKATNMSSDETNLIWLDLEMTGLDVDNDLIIEIATVVTDANLNVIAEGPSLAIYQPDAILDKMDEWNTSHHGKSGLIERVKNSSITEKVAEEQTLDFLKQYVPERASPMCGNSICQDRRFLHKHMKKLCNYFHYRNLDVSSIKILAQRWAPQIMQNLCKEPQHLALSDIHDSIDELRYYRDHFLKLNKAIDS